MAKKSNEIVKAFILNNLAKVEATHTYAIGIKENGMVRACIVENADRLLPLVTYCEQQASSHGSVYGVRMDGTKKNFEIIKAYATRIVDICSIKAFEHIYATEGNRGSNNRGHIFETLVAQTLGGKKNDSMTAKCTECGDINVNGVEIQVKLWNATISTEKTVENFMAQAGV